MLAKLLLISALLLPASTFKGGTLCVHRPFRLPPLRSTPPEPTSATPPSRPSKHLKYDVLILGSGPTSLSLAALLTSPSSSSSSGGAVPSVCVASSQFSKPWIPNYGAWTTEWESLSSSYASLGVSGLSVDAVDRRWSSTSCYFEEGEADASRVDVGAPYLRISRDGLKRCFTEDRGYDVVEADHESEALGVNVFDRGVAMDESGTTITLSDGTKVTARVVVDGTGAESRLTVRDRRGEGYQIAYGVECDVSVSGGKAGDYELDKMTLFDYRTGWSDDPSLQTAPTFMYVMPLGGSKVFFEETSLVAAPAVSFRTCMERLHDRLKAMGLKVENVTETEYCYIPMGGSVPLPHQRIVPAGAAAGLVHPSTGYQICRTLAANVNLASAIRESHGMQPDEASARAQGAVWTPEQVRQRDFAVFGGDFLMSQSAVGLQGFFEGFFKLDFEAWHGFLAMWRTLPNSGTHDTWYARLLFGVKFLAKLPPSVALALVASIATFTVRDLPRVSLPRSVTPLFGGGEGGGYEGPRGKEGDQAAKMEAREMMMTAEE